MEGVEVVSEEMSTLRPRLCIHLTNVTGTGAVRLAESLLPRMIDSKIAQVSRMFLPSVGDLAQWGAQYPQVPTQNIVRRLPNALSRLVECALPSRIVRGSDPVLVLGDLPLFCDAPQTLFIQTAHLSGQDNEYSVGDWLKYAVSRGVLRRNLHRVQAAIVQTEPMRLALLQSYPELDGRLHVIPQPVPQWLMSAKGSRRGPLCYSGEGLRLIYPAAYYPHKNHKILGSISDDQARTAGVRSISVTLEATQHPYPQFSWIRTVGRLDPEGMLELYANADALVFPSLQESFGFPLIEAMHVGLPIVAADRSFARVLCGDEAIYFDPLSARSLEAALHELNKRVKAGWWPNWSSQLNQLPDSWQEVADRILTISVRGS